MRLCNLVLLSLLVLFCSCHWSSIALADPSNAPLTALGMDKQFELIMQLQTKDNKNAEEEAYSLAQQTLFLRRLWHVELQVNSLIAEVQEESDDTTEAIEKIEVRKFRLASITNALTFLTLSSIFTVGNAIFIPAPPPRPTPPNELFTIAFGISTGFATLNLISQFGGSTMLSPRSSSSLSWLFSNNPPAPPRLALWQYFNASQDGKPSPKDFLLAKWRKEGVLNGDGVSKMFQPSLKKISSGRLRRRQSMLEDVQTELSKLSKQLALICRRLD
jgi:hypothetical protein